MGDYNSDVVGVKNEFSILGGEAGEKAVESVHGFWRHREIRKVSEAEAEAIRKKGQAVIEVNAEAKLKEAETDITIRKMYDQYEIERVQARLNFEAFSDQENIDAIVEKAIYKFLPKHVSKEPVKKDWTRKFFSKAKMVSDPEVQDMWSRILAGEIARPGSFSLRTLSILENMTKEDAEMFTKLAPCAYLDKIYLYHSNDFQKLDIQYFEILNLESMGLITYNDVSVTIIEFKYYLDGKNWGLFLQDENSLYFCSVESLDSITISQTIIITKVGSEISKLIKEKMPSKYIEYVISKLIIEYPKIEIRKYKITKQENDTVDFNIKNVEILWPKDANPSGE